MAIIGILFCGLAVAQLLATVHVWISNQNLEAILTSMRVAGYFTIPGPLVYPSLTSFKASFLGGLFFTLTIGTGVTLTTFAATYIYLTSKGKFKKNTINSNQKIPEASPVFQHGFNPAALLLFMIWIYCLVNLNINGICLMESLYFIAIPAIVIPLTYWWTKGLKAKIRFRRILIPIAPVVMLTLIWGTQWDENLFIRIRDHLLLETHTGRAINDFYYRYTLYPAEAFKPLTQKMLRACHLVDVEQTGRALQIEKILRSRDYLAVSAKETAELEIIGNGSNIIFHKKNAAPLEIPVDEFITNPRDKLEKVSQQGDSRGFFRSLVFYSLLFGFPLTLYAFLYGLINRAMGLIMRPFYAVATTSCLCFLAGLALFWPVWQSKTPPDALSDLNIALNSNQWHVRVAALQKICDQEKGRADVSHYKKSLVSPHISERYWLARALAFGRTQQTYADLLKLLQDSHPNIQCQAFYGLGNRNRRSAIPSIYKSIQTSDHWYVQWYGYRALRRLGWAQPQSTQKLF